MAGKETKPAILLEHESAVVPKRKTDRHLPASMDNPANSLARFQQTLGNQAVQRMLGALLIQAKLTVNQPGDQYEQEADRVAAQVMRMPERQTNPRPLKSPPSEPQCKCAGCQEAGKQLQRRETHAELDVAPPIVHQVLHSPGLPLDAATRAFMEPRFGYDFSGVRIHTDALAVESARAVSAKAFTVGSHVVFGEGYYSPEIPGGRKLLAHELTHVVQQGSKQTAGLVQRAEVDDRSCAGLTDIESDINTKVRTEIAAARTAAGTPIPPAGIPAFLRDVMNRLGSGPVSPIERFIEGLPPSKRIIPPSSLAGTKYAGVGAVNRFYHLQTLGLAHVVGSAANIHGICVGADKLGHFFEEGFTYFRVASTPAFGGSTAAAQSAGRALEIGIQGLGVGAPVGTGVYSNADQAANLAGMHFYQDLAATPTMTFNINSYITPAWNEQTNPSFYESAVAGVVWNNLLNGTWQGPFTSAGGTSAPIDTRVNLGATGTTVSGTYDWPATSPTNHGAITGGAITQITTSVSGTLPGEPSVSATPVSGIRIDFDWSEGSSTGKGTWSSVNEQTLTGTWGIGTSRTNGGTWRLNKIP